MNLFPPDTITKEALVATTRLSNSMITALLDSLTHPLDSGDSFEVIAPIRTTLALETRGKVERWEYRNNNGDTVTRFRVTAEGVTYLRNALEYVLNQRGDERDAVWTEWLDADYRHRDAVAALLVTDADTYEIATTTPHERGTDRETVTRDAARERMNNAIHNGQRITLHDGAMTVHTKLGARWTFTAQGFAVEVEHTSYERYTGAHGRGWARKMGTDNPASVRFMIHRANRRGDAVTVEDGGVIRVDNAGRVDPGHDGAGEPCPVWFVPVRPAEEEPPAVVAERQVAKISEHLGECIEVQMSTVLESRGLDCASDVDRDHALDVARGELACGADLSTFGNGYAVLKRKGRTTTLRAIAPSPSKETPEPCTDLLLPLVAEERPVADPEEAANLAARFLPQEADKPGSRPTVQIREPLSDGEVLVSVYRRDGRVVVYVDLDGCDSTVNDGTVPMVIQVQGREVYTA